MRSKAILMLGLAMIFAVVAVVLVKDWIDKRSTMVAEQKMPTTTVVVAKSPLSFGAIIRKEHLMAIRWPLNAVPKGAFRKIGEVVSDKKPRVALRRIEANEPLMKTKVSGFGGRASLSAIISSKMRATTIRVNDVNGVAGFVLPGDRVDIMLTRDRVTGKNSRNSQNLITDVLLQNVKVLAIDQDANENKEKPSVAKAVTLEVTSFQGQKLVLAQKVGTLSLALRNVTNGKAEATRTVRVSDLRIGEVVKPQPKPVVKKIVVKTITKRRVNRSSSIKVMRGLKASEYTVPREGFSVRSPVRLTPRVLRNEKSDRKQTSRGEKVPGTVTPDLGKGADTTSPPISLDRRRELANPVSVLPPVTEKFGYSSQSPADRPI